MSVFLTPRGGFLSESGTIEAVTPTGTFVSESGVASGDTALSIVAAATFSPAPRPNASGTVGFIAAGTATWSAAVGGGTTAFSFVGTSALGFGTSNISVPGAVYFTPRGSFLQNSADLEVFLPRGEWVHEDLPATTSIGASVLSVLAGGGVTWGGGAAKTAASAFAAAGNVTWVGTSFTTTGAAAWTGTGTVTWAGNQGVVFEFIANQTVMEAPAAAIHNVEWVIGAAGGVSWEPRQVPTDTAFNISASSTLTLNSLATDSTEVSIVPAAVLTMHGTFVPGTEFANLASSNLVWSQETIVPTSQFTIVAAATAAFASTPAIEANVAWYSPATAFVLWNGQEIRASGFFDIQAVGRLGWGSPRQAEAPNQDDDDRRELWMGAAQAEREQRERQMAIMQDEDDLIILAAAFAEAYRQWRQ